MEKQNALCYDESYVKRVISQVDWDFMNTAYLEEGVIPPFNIRKHHGYLATFTPALPYVLIEALTHPGAVVLDPFLGIGTTYLQALILGRKPLGIESCHIATQFLKAFVYLFQNSKQISFGLQEWYDVKSSYNKDFRFNGTDFPKSFHLLEPWYHPETYHELCYLKGCLSSSKNTIFIALVNIVLSNSLIRLSSQNRGWGYIADNVKPKELRPKYLFKTLENKIQSLIKDIYYLRESFSKSSYGGIAIDDNIIQTSIFQQPLPISKRSIDAIITSPPYPNMMDYALSQRLSYYFWNLPFEGDVRNEFATRRNRKHKNANDEYIQLFFQFNSYLMDLLKKNGYLCYVLPDFHSDNPKKIIIDKIISAMKDNGAKKIAHFSRYISSTKRASNTSMASLDKELIVILRKE